MLYCTCIDQSDLTYPYILYIEYKDNLVYNDLLLDQCIDGDNSEKWK